MKANDFNDFAPVAVKRPRKTACYGCGTRFREGWLMVTGFYCNSCYLEHLALVFKDSENAEENQGVTIDYSLSIAHKITEKCKDVKRLEAKLDKMWLFSNHFMEMKNNTAMSRGYVFRDGSEINIANDYRNIEPLHTTRTWDCVAIPKAYAHSPLRYAN